MLKLAEKNDDELKAAAVAAPTRRLDETRADRTAADELDLDDLAFVDAYDG